MRVIVVGGGLLGMMTARELSKSGASVRLLEQGHIGRESSWAGGGILSPLYPWNYADSVNALAKWSQQHYPKLVTELIEEGGIDPQWTRSGLLVTANEAEADTLFATATAWARDYGLSCEQQDGRMLHEQEPALVADRGLLFPEVAQIRNPRLIKSLQASCQSRGIELLENSPVSGLLVSGSSVRGVTVGEIKHEADVVVICAGAWSARLLSSMKIEVPIKPLRGQMLMYRTSPGQIRHITLSEGHYVIPRRDGRVLAGSTLEDVGFDKSTTNEALVSLRQSAETLFPCLAEAELEAHWSGLRPESAAGIPYICAAPDVDGLFLNAGHFRNGVVLAPASARLVAELILQQTPILNALDYGFER